MASHADLHANTEPFNVHACMRASAVLFEALLRSRMQPHRQIICKRISNEPTRSKFAAHSSHQHISKVALQDVALHGIASHKAVSLARLLSGLTMSLVPGRIKCKSWA